MAIATGLISSLFNVALSIDVPFCQLQQLQCLHHGSKKLTFVLLCTPFLSPLPRNITICGTHTMASVQDLGKCSVSRGASYVILCLECQPNVRRAGSETKRNDTPC